MGGGGIYFYEAPLTKAQAVLRIDVDIRPFIYELHLRSVKR